MTKRPGNSAALQNALARRIISSSQRRHLPSRSGRPPSCPSDLPERRPRIPKVNLEPEAVSLIPELIARPLRRGEPESGGRYPFVWYRSGTVVPFLHLCWVFRIVDRNTPRLRATGPDRGRFSPLNQPSLADGGTLGASTALSSCLMSTGRDTGSRGLAVVMA